jgi:hypothetical protein
MVYSIWHRIRLWVASLLRQNNLAADFLQLPGPVRANGDPWFSPSPHISRREECHSQPDITPSTQLAPSIHYYSRVRVAAVCGVFLSLVLMFASWLGYLMGGRYETILGIAVLLMVLCVSLLLQEKTFILENESGDLFNNSNYQV